MLGRAIPGTMAVVLAAMAVAAVAVTMLSVVQTPVGRVELDGMRMRQAMAISGPRQATLAFGNQAPHALFFECDGRDNAHRCMAVVNQCVEKAEADIYDLYKVDPRLATESRPGKVCSCFSSNGCMPSCNVQMYVLWATESKITCPSAPPVFVPSANVFHYGDPNDVEQKPSDISYEYFPQYPNPAGHRYYGPVPDYEYRMPDFYNHRYNMDPEEHYRAPKFAPSKDASPYSPYWYAQGDGSANYYASPYDWRIPAIDYSYVQPPARAFPEPLWAALDEPRALPTRQRSNWGDRGWNWNWGY